MAYEFHYTPTGTGVISGKEVLEQTEDAINDLGNTAISGVQEALDKAEQALTNSENAVDDAQTALNTANNAEGVAIQAQNDVSNLSGTVTNIGNRVTTAEGNITNLQGRMTTAEGNITNLQGRMTTTESNIGNLQTAVSTAQATANSAQQTATTARQQSYVFRYSSTALVASSTNSNALLDNTDNLKVGDKVIDSDGVLFSVTAIDTENSTFTIGTALIDLLSSDLFNSANTWTGNNSYTGIVLLNSSSDIAEQFKQKLPKDVSVTTDPLVRFNTLTDSTDHDVVVETSGHWANYVSKSVTLKYKNDSTKQGTIDLRLYSDGAGLFYPQSPFECNLGNAGNQWNNLYAKNYYYNGTAWGLDKANVWTGTSNTFSAILNQNINSVYSEIPSSDHFAVKGVTDNNGNNVFVISFADRSSGQRDLTLRVYNTDGTSQGVGLYKNNDNSYDYKPMSNNVINLGTSTDKWKSLNGVEPSSLSLPSGNANDVIDISSYITALDGTSNSYTVPANGWISIAVVGTAIAIISSSWSDSRLRESSGNVRMLYPVLKNETLDISVIGTTLDYARFIPCQGNV